MVEQLHSIMNDRRNTSHNNETLSRRQRFIRRGVPLVIATTAFTGIGAGAAINHLNQTEVLGTTTGTVNNGESPQRAIVDGAVEIAEKNGLDINTVTGAKDAAQKVTKKVFDTTGKPVQPGLYLDVQVKRNNWGATWVDADPANLADLAPPEK
jgi:hypothetical protein